MTHTVYGLRLRGDTEVRYIGQTRRPLEGRLLNHFSANNLMVWPNEFAKWMRLGAEDIEIFAIAQCDGEVAAKAKERELIAVCIAFQHRLFNVRHVPKELRCSRGTDFPQFRQDALAAANPFIQ